MFYHALKPLNKEITYKYFKFCQAQFQLASLVTT